MILKQFYTQPMHRTIIVTNLDCNAEEFLKALQHHSEISILSYTNISSKLTQFDSLRISIQFTNKIEFFKFLLEMNSEMAEGKLKISSPMSNEDYKEFTEFLCPMRVYISGYSVTKGYKSIIKECLEFGTISYSNLFIDPLGSISGYIQYHSTDNAQRAKTWLPFVSNWVQTERIVEVAGADNTIDPDILCTVGQLAYFKNENDRILLAFQRNEDLMRFVSMIPNIPAKLNLKFPNASNTLYMKNLSPIVTVKEVQRFFSSVSPNVKVDLFPPKVEFKNPAECETALRNLNNKVLGFGNISLHKDNTTDFESFYKVKVERIPKNVDQIELKRILGKVGKIVDIEKTGSHAVVKFDDLRSPDKAVKMASVNALSKLRLFVSKFV